MESAVYDLMQWVIERTGPLPVLLERDTNIPALDELLDEVERLDDAYQRAVDRHARGGQESDDARV